MMASDDGHDSAPGNRDGSDPAIAFSHITIRWQ